MITAEKKAGQPFHVLAKPIGPICNLDCSYCFYLSKENLLHRGDQKQDWRMREDVLEEYVRQYINEQHTPEINFAWQGGEPTLMGVDFFRKVVQLQEKHCPPNKRVSNALQTNGTLLDDAWGEFLHENNFLVGLSIDGPRELHDTYRVNKGQKPTFDQVLRGVGFLRKHQVEHNYLVVVNRVNALRPLEVYRFLRDELQADFMQFIPCVEPKDFRTAAPNLHQIHKKVKIGDPETDPGHTRSVVTDWSVKAEDYGDFLCTIFDEWLRRDVGKVFVQLFDVALGCWSGIGSSLCVFAETCGNAICIEHDGDVYSCDHYVYPEYKIGNVMDQPLGEMMNSPFQKNFGAAKRDSLPQYCRDCEVRFACNGECPKSRFIHTPDGDEGLNYLCAGLRKFFNHVDPWMKRMAEEIRNGRPAANIMLQFQKPRRRKTRNAKRKP
jgi:uncharacterized protein